MKLAMALLLLTTSIYAQNKTAPLPASCGPAKLAFDFKTESSPHSKAQPEAGKALVYIIQQSGLACTPGGWCAMRVGLDGAWMGGFRVANGFMHPGSFSNSYFSFSIEPGEHHLCSDGQSGEGDMIALTHFTAEAGKIYYFRIRGVQSAASRWLDISPVDNDEAKYLIATSPLSISTPK